FPRSGIAPPHPLHPLARGVEGDDTWQFPPSKKAGTVPPILPAPGRSSPPAAAPASPAGTRAPTGWSKFSSPAFSCAAVAAAVCLRWRHVKGGVFLEESGRLEVKPDVLRGHHGPVLRPRQVMRAHGVPDDDIRVLDGAPVFNVLGQSLAAGMLVGIIAGRV